MFVAESYKFTYNNNMSQAGETFFTAVGCMDGRVQEPIALYGQQKFGVTYSDTVTEAGLVGQLAKADVSQSFLDSLVFKVFTVSAGKHSSRGIIVHGHQECAGNPVPDEQHKKDVLTATEKLTELMKLQGITIPIIPVFVVREGAKWVVEEL